MSIRVFREFLTPRPDGTVDASRVTSRECYLAFLAAKKSEDSPNEAKKFRRTLTTHLTGVDGRRAFETHEEAAILHLLRENRPWPCFPPELQVGTTFRGKGFHEKQQQQQQQQQQEQAEEQQPVAPKRIKRAVEAPPPPPIVASDVVVLPPPPPLEVLDVLNPDDTQFVHQLASHMVGITKTFVSLGVDCWRTISRLFRFVILARTKAVHKHVPERYAQDLCAKYSLEHPAAAVTIMDLTHKQFDHRIRAQNDRSRAEFGDMVDNLDGMWMRYPDLFHVAVAIGTTYSAPGKAVAVRQSYMVRGDELEQWDVTYHVDPESFLLVGVGRPTREAEGGGV